MQFDTFDAGDDERKGKREEEERSVRCGVNNERTNKLPLQYLGSTFTVPLRYAWAYLDTPIFDGSRYKNMGPLFVFYSVSQVPNLIASK